MAADLPISLVASQRVPNESHTPLEKHVLHLHPLRPTDPPSVLARIFHRPTRTADFQVQCH